MEECREGNRFTDLT